MNLSRTLFVAVWACFAFLSVRLEADVVLFSIQEENAIAESLPYGPAFGQLMETDSAFLDTSLGSQLHDRWYQKGVDGDGNTLYEISWKFSSSKTVAQRLQDAVDVGEVVDWTVTSPSLAGPELLSGTWRFSSGAGDLMSRFDGSSGANFVTDGGPLSPGNGIWGAGSGVVDGTTAFAFPASTNLEWGYGNQNGSDFYTVTGMPIGGILVTNGNVQPSLPSGFKNLMFVETAAVPEPSSFLFLGLVVMGACCIRRFRKVAG